MPFFYNLSLIKWVTPFCFCCSGLCFFFFTFSYSLSDFIYVILIFIFIFVILDTVLTLELSPLDFLMSSKNQ